MKRFQKSSEVFDENHEHDTCDDIDGVPDGQMLDEDSEVVARHESGGFEAEHVPDHTEKGDAHQ